MTGRNETSMDGDKAIDVTATLIAKKAAKAKPTTSELYMEGYKDALVWAAKRPEGLEILAELVAENEKPLPPLLPKN